MPIQIDAKLNAFRRSSRGFFITLEVGPDSDWAELAAAPLGTAFGVALVAYDAETGTPVPVSQLPSAVPNTGQQRGETGKPRKPWNGMGRAQQAGILCGDHTFQLWLSKRLNYTVVEDCAEALRNYLNIHSRAALDDGLHDKAAVKFDALVAAYRQDTGQMAEAR
jgi:hypothetical protein